MGKFPYGKTQWMNKKNPWSYEWTYSDKTGNKLISRVAGEKSLTDVADYYSQRTGSDYYDLTARKRGGKKSFYVHKGLV